jgi:hypothetical protein
MVGILLNVGWFADAVLAYPGELGDRVPLAVFKPLFGENTNLTLGDDTWTYAQLAALVQALRKGAVRHLGREDFRVGMLMLGWSSIYYAHTPVWFRRHRESFRWGRTSMTDPPYLFLDWSSCLRPDQERYAAFPNGIPAGLGLPEFFAAQWERFVADTGFDVINLRDGMLGLANYRHASPAWDGACFEGVRALLRGIKTRSPGTLTMGYSVAGSALAELRCHSFDLRTLARDGFLDVWITQSWGCNWIEQKRLELTPAMQTATILAHRALLEGTGVRHLCVLNLLDAFEFLTLRPFRGRWEALRWEIWSYSHTALRRRWPEDGTWGLHEGARFALGSGFYASWFHVREEMLALDEVSDFSHEIEAATADARSLDACGGAMLVIHDDWARARNHSGNPHAYDGEHVDEAAGLLIRAGVPVHSAARITELDPADRDTPLVVHHPQNLPLDLAHELSHKKIVLTIGSAALNEGSGILWNPADDFDPLGDGRALRDQVLPGRTQEIANQLSRQLPGPYLENPATDLLHFVYWQSGGTWRFLLGNIEVGAVDRTVVVFLPQAWTQSHGIERPALRLHGGGPQWGS